ncbi:DUF4037 domain-containing protein [Chloroflexi bacterium TSY]|nr:DUF4037 domain-containing protein [Chloroflexi bacterium TSY]
MKFGSTESIIQISHAFFEDIVKPILQEHFPQETAQTAFGIFGYGSEALQMDDEYSRDHHWGLRIDALMPDDLFQNRRQIMMETLSQHLPASFQGYSLREGHLAGAGLAPDSLPAYLRRTIGLEHAPQSYVEWLSMPEEDIVHVINGEVWHDPKSDFTSIRQTLNDYYPEPVRLRRIAHWCRYFSGMGTYALKRAILRKNDYYANITFSRALRLGVQLAFLLDKQYAPYDKWTLAFLEKLPRLAAPLLPVIHEASSLATSWERKLELLNQMADILDQTMVHDGLIQSHPQFQDSPTSGYRLLEHAYAEIIKGLPQEIKTVVPVWDQIYLEEFHSGYVDTLELDEWDHVLNLIPE